MLKNDDFTLKNVEFAMKIGARVEHGVYCERAATVIPRDGP